MMKMMMMRPRSLPSFWTIEEKKRRIKILLFETFKINNIMSCESLDILNSIKRDIESRKSSKFDEALLRHVDACIESWKPKQMLKFHRTVDGLPEPGAALTWKALSDTREFGSMVNLNCHNGQKKLTYSVLEFLGKALGKHKQSDVTVVYAGASGLATVIAASIFKGIEFVLYDPEPNTFELIPSTMTSEVQIVRRANQPLQKDKRILLYTGEQMGYFTDDRAREIGKTLAEKGRIVLFISDIRKDADEASIANDMYDQQRWALLTRSWAYMFKFRMPYEQEKKEKEQEKLKNLIRRLYGDFEHMRRAASEAGVYFESPEQPRVQDDGSSFVFRYLSGDLHVQLYPRVSTAELRLIGFAKPHGKDKVQSYATCAFDRGAIESKMALFNFLYRSHARFEGALPRLGMQPTYETIAEIDIVKRCCNKTNDAGTTVKIQDQRTMLDFVNDTIDTIIKGKFTIASCAQTNSFKLKRSLAAMPDGKALKGDLRACLDKSQV
jgi:hypothetical protein